MKLSALKTNTALIEQGRWIENIPDLPGVRLHVRGLGNSDYKRLYQSKMTAVPRADKIRGLAPETSERIVSECLHESILLDWSGLTDDAGEAVPYTADQAKQLLTDPDYGNFRSAVVWAASVVDDGMAGAAA